MPVDAYRVQQTHCCTLLTRTQVPGGLIVALYVRFPPRSSRVAPQYLAAATCQWSCSLIWRSPDLQKAIAQ
jgi:hypothetical protein